MQQPDNLLLLKILLLELTWKSRECEGQYCDPANMLGHDADDWKLLSVTYPLLE